MTQGYYIKLIDQNNNVIIGTIEYYYEDDEQNINLSNIFIEEEYRNKSYGTFLIYLMLKSICTKVLVVKSISLDDCSDYALTIKSIYYKLGFRIPDASTPEQMKIFFTSDIKEQESISKLYHSKKRKYSDIPDDIYIYKNVKEYCQKHYKDFRFDIDIIIEEGYITDATYDIKYTSILKANNVFKICKKQTLCQGGSKTMLYKNVKKIIMYLLNKMTVMKLKTIANQNKIKYTNDIRKTLLIEIICKTTLFNVKNF